MGLQIGGHTPSLAAPPPPNGGNRIIRAATRRRYSASQLLMLQNPHHSQPEVRRATSKTGAGPIGAKKLAQHCPSTGISVKNSPCTPQNADFGPFFVRRANFFAHRTPPVATLQPMTPLRPLVQASMKPPSPLHALEQQPLKPPSPLLAPEQRPLKPPSPLQAKTTP